MRLILCFTLDGSDLAFYGIYAASGLVTGILAVWLEKIFVIVATSFTGSLMFLLGRCETTLVFFFLQKMKPLQE